MQAMDQNGDGSVSFDEWLSFSLAEIISKVFILIIINIIIIVIIIIIIIIIVSF